MRKRFWIFGTLFLLLAANGFSAPHEGAGKRPAGTWTVQGTPATQAVPPFVNFASFTRDGRIVNVDPAVGTALGEWAGAGGHEFKVTFAGFAVMNGQILKYKVRALIAMGEDGDTFSGAFRSDVSDLNGNPVLSYDGTVLATRIEVEDL
jgi:hypothetical protein